MTISTGQILYELGYVPSSYRREKQENRQDRVGGPAVSPAESIRTWNKFEFI